MPGLAHLSREYITHRIQAYAAEAASFAMLKGLFRIYDLADTRFEVKVESKRSFPVAPRPACGHRVSDG